MYSSSSQESALGESRSHTQSQWSDTVSPGRMSTARPTPSTLHRTASTRSWPRTSFEPSNDRSGCGPRRRHRSPPRCDPNGYGIGRGPQGAGLPCRRRAAGRARDRRQRRGNRAGGRHPPAPPTRAGRDGRPAGREPFAEGPDQRPTGGYRVDELVADPVGLGERRLSRGLAMPLQAAISCRYGHAPSKRAARCPRLDEVRAVRSRLGGGRTGTDGPQ